ncbi:succinate dehydrogenase subunit B [Magnetococcus marinus MC-1]|uniref:Fumarate reductase iron-sulfur subunit n=1 Tax=Magnetococcus marinus (strain ATCC BAA-1437 / JCM 17883 / MC-1) TaxID=156889 RepID=A0L4R2_MAGMM|nr:2Fe-2S iron-sulfur cluster-binding protein [Magnetococcus marinus]ABK42955.1 succinate dehydrogenase subunit B [Magnetococcus marinus MC-1]
MSDQVYTLRIQRNVRRDDGTLETKWDEFQVKATPLTPVLNLLEDVKGNQDGSLTFRQSCRSAICGSCAMRIGGKTRLACKTQIGEVVDENNTVQIAPQQNSPVLKDLVVDITKFFNKVHQIKPYLQEGAESATEVNDTAFDQVNHVTQCIMCACCFSDCTMAEVSDAFIGPAALAKAFRFVSDPREGNKRERLRVLSQDHGIWSCSRCTMCVMVCPKDVKPMEAIVKLRTRAMDAGNVSGYGAKHAQAFHGDITSNGSLNEAFILNRTLGVLGALGEMGAALHLAKKGKIPSPFPHKIANLGEVQAIYDALEKNPLDVETKAENAVPE